MNPTQKQIKKFLQWCGFTSYYKSVAEESIDNGILAWIQPPNSEETIAYYGITLDFLFKYAVPIAINKIMEEQKCSSDLAYAILFKKWLQKLELDIPNYENTLFCAIWEIIKA